MPSTRKAAAIGVPIIVLLLLGFFGAAYLLSAALGLPQSLGLPTAVRVGGGILVVAGTTLAAWMFASRKPSDVVVSTYITFSKLFKRVSFAERAGRTEPLVVSGPQKYVRSPLYLGVIVMVLGWAVLSTSTFVFLGTLILLFWFGAVLIPFEEKELKTLFGDEWVGYAEGTPMLIPFTKRKKAPS